MIGFLINPRAPDAGTQTSRAETAAQALGLRVAVVNAISVSDFEPAFARLVEQQAGALVVGGDEFFGSEAARIIGLAARHAIPAIYPLRAFTALGGMASYSANLPEAIHQVGVYAARILKGAKPSELPVVQATRFELVINLKTAAALGLAVPQSVLARADDVIE